MIINITNEIVERIIPAIKNHLLLFKTIFFLFSELEGFSKKKITIDKVMNSKERFLIKSKIA